jgi:hypothetical protein
LINTFNPTKGIVLNKGQNTVFGQMKIFQVWENKPQQILILPTNVVKQFQKIGTIWAIKHAFVWRIVYEKNVANVSVRKFRSENIKVLMENWFVTIIR